MLNFYSTSNGRHERRNLIIQKAWYKPHRTEHKILYEKVDYKDNVSLQKAFSDATNLLSKLRTRPAHNTLGLSNPNCFVRQKSPPGARHLWLVQNTVCRKKYEHRFSSVSVTEDCLCDIFETHRFLATFCVQCRCTFSSIISFYTTWHPSKFSACSYFWTIQNPDWCRN